MLYVLYVKPIQGGSSSLYFFDDYVKLTSTFSKYFSRGYTFESFCVLRSVEFFDVLASITKTSIYGFRDAFTITVLSYHMLLDELSLTKNLLKIVINVS